MALSGDPSSLSGEAHTVLHSLQAHANRKGVDCRPPEEIAEELGWSRDDTVDVLDDLANVGRVRPHVDRQKAGTKVLEPCVCDAGKLTIVRSGGVTPVRSPGVTPVRSPDLTVVSSPDLTGVSFPDLTGVRSLKTSPSASESRKRTSLASKGLHPSNGSSGAPSTPSDPTLRDVVIRKIGRPSDGAQKKNLSWTKTLVRDGFSGGRGGRTRADVLTKKVSIGDRRSLRMSEREALASVERHPSECFARRARPLSLFHNLEGESLPGPLVGRRIGRKRRSPADADSPWGLAAYFEAKAKTHDSLDRTNKGALCSSFKEDLAIDGVDAEILRASIDLLFSRIGGQNKSNLWRQYLIRRKALIIDASALVLTERHRHDSSYWGDAPDRNTEDAGPALFSAPTEYLERVAARKASRAAGKEQS